MIITTLCYHCHYCPTTRSFTTSITATILLLQLRPLTQSLLLPTEKHEVRWRYHYLPDSCAVETAVEQQLVSMLVPPWSRPPSRTVEPDPADSVFSLCPFLSLSLSLRGGEGDYWPKGQSMSGTDESDMFNVNPQHVYFDSTQLRSGQPTDCSSLV